MGRCLIMPAGRRPGSDLGPLMDGLVIRLFLGAHIRTPDGAIHSLRSQNPARIWAHWGASLARNSSRGVAKADSAQHWSALRGFERNGGLCAAL
jgi:hypothetical protein